MTAALVTSDDKVCFLKRSAVVGAYPNMLDVPGGHPEPQVRSCFPAISSSYPNV